MSSHPLVKLVVLSACAFPVLGAWSPDSQDPVVPPRARAPIGATLYADGSVGCSGADDLTERAGEVTLRAVPDGIAFQVVLAGAAANWPYYVELSRNGGCSVPQQFRGFRTDSHGNGVFTGVYRANRGDYSLLVDVVSDPGTRIPPNPKYREIAPADLISVVVK